MTETCYTFVLDDAERERYRSMASEAERTEAPLWDLAGITTGARVLDVGCGPGAFLEILAARVAPTGKAAIERRLAESGPLQVGVPVYVVVAEPA
jgi:cyclopropane fatty-acyl-phospholipid synthase-like methyltransferase